jgi:hypothetical protein
MTAQRLRAPSWTKVTSSACGKSRARPAMEKDLKQTSDPTERSKRLEIEIGAGEVPGGVMQALKMFAPQFVPAQDGLIEKSVRPSDVGLPIIWYEFSGSNFDVEVRSDGKAVLIEPA